MCFSAETKSYGLTMHLYGIFLAAAFALDMASLHDLRESQTVSLLVSKSKHVLSSTEKV